MERAMLQARSDAKAGNRTGGVWKQQGPANIGARINAIAVHPTDENIIFAGFADGGLWKTIDGGATWNAVFDNEVVQAIGSICFDPINPDNVYVGTGDPNISGYPRGGGGMYKSQDMGKTWQYIGLKAANIISKIVIPVSNPSTIYASAMGIPFYKNSDKGVYKSTDGGATWAQVLFINDDTGVSDIVLHPTNPDLLYAVGWNRIRNSYTSLVSGPDARIWRTKDGGGSWEVLSNGLPEGDHTRMGIAIAHSNPSVIYAQYTDAVDLEFKALYKSTDGGDTWKLHTALGEKQLQGSPLGGFGWYFGKIEVNPADENDIFLLGVGLYRYQSQSDAWQSVDYTNDGSLYVHADKHDLYIRGNNLYLATDGGLYKSKVNSILEWQDIESIPTTQFYRTAYDPHVANRYWGGAQDNGTSAGNAASKDNWERYYGGDGFQMAFHPDDDQILFAESQRGNIVVSKNGGNSWQGASAGLTGSRHWDMQYIISSHDPDVMYTGTDRFLKNANGTEVDWQPISPVLTNPLSTTLIKQITSVSESPVDERILYCGTTDAMVWTSRDAGDTWDNISAGLPERYVSSIKASPTFKNTAYVTFTGYKDNDSNPHIYRTNNAGLTWTAIAGNLPPLAINDVYIYPNGLDDVLFVATDGGIYITRDGGVQWERLGNNMPLIPVFDMEYDPTDNALIAATFARGIQTYDLSQIGVQLETKTDQLYADHLEVYPTITDQYVYVKGLSDAARVAVYDANGKQILKTVGSTIDFSELSDGIYIIKAGGKSAQVVKL
jgi:photosystem II stability/assembly factor-like uncharacterized protein